MKVPQSLGPAKAILDVFKAHQSRAGDGFQVRTFLAHGRTLGMEPSGVADAIKAAKDAGYVEDGPSGGIVLTEAGRAALR